MLSYILGKLGFRVIKVFRMLRVLRPLRVISRNEGLKLSLNSLFISINALINVFYFLIRYNNYLLGCCNSFHIFTYFWSYWSKLF